MMIFTRALFLLVSLDTALSVFYQSKTITLSSSKEEVIKSPGYPHKNWPRDTNYTWNVIASDDTEEISINITTDIREASGFRCNDYLKIQEIQSLTRRFTLFKRCGKHTAYMTARGNRLLITLISNDDKLTSKGFELTLKVLKVGTTLTTKTTSTQSTTTKTRTTASTVKTTESLLISEDIELSPSYVLLIKSPGYPKVNYKSNTIYTWNVTAPAETKEILIDINMDIIRPSRGFCEDYLKIQEIDPFGGSFTIFNECGKLTMKRSALGNRLLIKLVSNYDEFTSKGFELNLRVLNDRITTSILTTRTSISSSTAEMRSSIRGRITTEATNSISTSNWSLPVPIATQKKQYLTTQEQPTHSTYSALAMTMETTSKDITPASLVLNDRITASTLTTRTSISSSTAAKMRSSIRGRITTAATNSISTSNWSLPVPMQHKRNNT